MSISYRSAGVNIDAGNQFVKRIGTYAASTHTAEVLSGLGGFGSFYDVGSILKEFHHPVMVQSIDGVGTKIMIASMMNDFTSIGRDLVAACCNDIIVHGARPVTFLDYIANDQLDPETAANMVAGMAAGCREAGLSLVGGETAEMPGTYLKGEHDLVGIVTGFVEKELILTGSQAKPGDVIFGIPSSGLHTNGYSLARKALFEHAGMKPDAPIPAHYGDNGAKSLGQLLLEPHINYTQSVLNLLRSGIPVTSMAHITGGGLIDNIPRMLPDHVCAVINPESWSIPPLFTLIADAGEIDRREMYHTFNMGIGYTIMVPRKHTEHARKAIEQCFNVQPFVIGELQEGDTGVSMQGITDGGIA
ncbi:MAG: phosphoribosylformylglycinamidine cyclo-ligase [Spirochaetota bacterium]